MLNFHQIINFNRVLKFYDAHAIFESNMFPTVWEYFPTVFRRKSRSRTTSLQCAQNNFSLKSVRAVCDISALSRTTSAAIFTGWVNRSNVSGTHIIRIWAQTIRKRGERKERKRKYEKKRYNLRYSATVRKTEFVEVGNSENNPLRVSERQIIFSLYDFPS